jgi:hypothetical protein
VKRNRTSARTLVVMVYSYVLSWSSFIYHNTATKALCRFKKRPISLEMDVENTGQKKYSKKNNNIYKFIVDEAQIKVRKDN